MKRLSGRLLGIVAVMLCAAGVFFVVPAFLRYSVAIHQRGVADELAAWRSQYSSIDSKADAIRTAEMLGYVQSYYLPAAGYRGTAESEHHLTAEREATVTELIGALKNHTGLDFGNDASAWKVAIEGQRIE